MPLLILLLWVVLNGKITLEILLFGVAITVLITIFAYRVIGYSVMHDLRVIRNLPILLLYILNLIYEILKAAFKVTSMVYQADEPDPVIVEFHSGFKNRLQNVLLANSITLTPGTITVFLEEDHFVVHAVRREYAEGIESSSFIKLLRKMK
ncbi:MAG: Na+/H+ antiporter subunit E [Clostridiales bacterium]|nr:Na+/H+ antiporter subunit E [Clostridiales bacterium]